MDSNSWPLALWAAEDKALHQHSCSYQFTKGKVWWAVYPSKLMLIRPGAYPGFCSIKQLGLLLLLDGMLVHCKPPPRLLQVPIYTSASSEASGVKCAAEGHSETECDPAEIRTRYLPPEVCHCTTALPNSQKVKTKTPSYIWQSHKNQYQIDVFHDWQSKKSISTLLSKLWY
jgi:hypothetical protein